LHFVTASFEDRIMTLLAEDDDDRKSHGFCEMSMDNFKIEALKKQNGYGTYIRPQTRGTISCLI
jgi:hypothetical protein